MIQTRIGICIRTGIMFEGRQSGQIKSQLFMIFVHTKDWFKKCMIMKQINNYTCITVHFWVQKIAG